MKYLIKVLFCISVLPVISCQSQTFNLDQLTEKESNILIREVAGSKLSLYLLSVISESHGDSETKEFLIKYNLLEAKDKQQVSILSEEFEDLADNLKAADNEYDFHVSYRDILINLAEIYTIVYDQKNNYEYPAVSKETKRFCTQIMLKVFKVADV